MCVRVGILYLIRYSLVLASLRLREDTLDPHSQGAACWLRF